MRSKVRKVLGYIIFLLVTVIVLGFSFMMPTLTAQMQDSIIQRQTNTQSIREVTLATTGVDEEISELLLFASSGYYTIDYEISFSDDMAAAKRATALEIETH